MGEDESLLGGGRDDETSERQEVEEGENKETEEGPDGGWGWLVVLACFCTTFTLDGIGYSFGMFMKPLKKEMKEDNMEASSIGSLQIAVYLFSGPLVARLVSKFGARAVAITGSLLAALGLLGASLSSTLPVLMLRFLFLLNPHVQLCHSLKTLPHPHPHANPYAITQLLGGFWPWPRFPLHPWSCG